MEYDIVSNVITTSVVKAKPITLEAENSPASFADWGDTYFCSTTLLWGVNSNGEKPVTDRKPKTFKCNLNKAKQSLVFSEGSPFGYEALDVTFTIFARDGQESFDLKGNRSTAAYLNGVFTYSHTDCRQTQDWLLAHQLTNTH